MTNADGPLGLMGGAFDPVHIGHLRTAFELHEQLGLSEVRLIPSATPPHRPPHFADADVRLRMLEAAVADLPWCTVDSRELQREGPSWSVLTLEEVRAESGERSVCMILGMDAFLGLPGWHRWQELTGLANIVVARRPGSRAEPGEELARLLAESAAQTPEELHTNATGRVYIQDITQLEISSSAIRAEIAAGREPRYLVPDEILEVIKTTGVYRDSAGSE